MPKIVDKSQRDPVWGRTYRRAVRRGDDHGYAGFLADQAEKRCKHEAVYRDNSAGVYRCISCLAVINLEIPA